MQKAGLVLTKLSQKAQTDPAFRFKRLYRNLFNPGFYLKANFSLYRKGCNTAEGGDGTKFYGFSMLTVERIINKLRYERFKPYPLKKVCILKEDKRNTWSSGTFQIEDRLVQEVLRQILEAIYEPGFSKNSHGFRPGKSIQIALYHIKRTGKGSTWVIEGDIKNCFDTIDHSILIGILARKIDDLRFLLLIESFLKAGILEEGKIKDPLTRVPGFGIVRPILLNIYLNELDTFIEEISKKYTKGIRRKINPVYVRLMGKRTANKRKGQYKEANKILKRASKLQVSDPMDPDYRRVRYGRFLDDFVILIHGPKVMAEQIKADVSVFLKDTLKLKLDMEKTLITNILKKRVRYLGYEFCKAKDDTKVIRNKNGMRHRSLNGEIQLLIPAGVIKEKIKPFTRHGKPSDINRRTPFGLLGLIYKYNTETKKIVLLLQVGK